MKALHLEALGSNLVCIAQYTGIHRIGDVLDVHAVLEHIVGNAVGNVVALDGDVDVDGDFVILNVDAGKTVVIRLATWFVSWVVTL